MTGHGGGGGGGGGGQVSSEKECKQRLNMGYLLPYQVGKMDSRRPYIHVCTCIT